MLNIIGITGIACAIALEFGIIVMTESNIRYTELRAMYQRMGLE